VDIVWERQSIAYLLISLGEEQSGFKQTTTIISQKNWDPGSNVNTL
jgi:hypothetical protein